MTRDQRLSFYSPLFGRILQLDNIAGLKLAVIVDEVRIKSAHFVLVVEDVKVSGVLVAVNLSDVPESITAFNLVSIDVKVRVIDAEIADVDKTEEEESGGAKSFFKFVTQCYHLLTFYLPFYKLL